jgi:hypothetical protein
MIGYHIPERLLHRDSELTTIVNSEPLPLPITTSSFGISVRFLSHYPVVCFSN